MPSLTIFVGLIMVALPIGIVATAFADEIHRRDFVVTWGMVARVPLFAELRASEIADIMRLLRAQQVEPGAIIARRGEPGAFDVFHRRRRGRDRAQAEDVRLGRRPFLRRDRGAAPRAALRHRYRASRARACWCSTLTICMP